jgi:hypothetical protein
MPAVSKAGNQVTWNLFFLREQKENGSKLSVISYQLSVFAATTAAARVLPRN